MANFLSRLVDPLDDDRERVARKYQFTRDWRVWAVPAGAGAVLVLISLLGLVQDHYQFWYAYLTGYTFCLSISIGALFFVMFNHVVKARWVTVVRRFPEMLMTNFVVLAVLAVPMLVFGLHDLYHWTHAELYDTADPYFDPIVAGKAGYFFWPARAGTFPAFFFLRVVVYFAVWAYVARRLYTLSVRHDVAPAAGTAAAMRRTSAWGIPVVGVLTSFAAYDFMMSLDPHWFSTIFGVYFFAGAILAALAAMTLMALAYQKGGMLRGLATPEHFHDLGKYLFGFTVFWMYIWFSQYMLIWYANIPEETMWFEHRLSHGWETATILLIVFHFVLPFFLLIPRFTKRIAPALAVMCGWLLVMHFIDHWWVVKPNLFVATGMDVRYERATLSWVDLTMWLGMFGLFAGATLWRASRHAIAPYNDPYYASSLKFENV
jgi:hypothetical protein